MSGGQAITSGQGTVTQSASVPLVGSALTGGIGTIVADAGNGVALTGSASSSALGTLVSGPIVFLRSRKVGGGSASRALTGIAASFAQGSAVATPLLAPSGQAITTAQGALAKDRSKQLTGQAVTPAAGTVLSSGSALTWIDNIFPMTVARGGFFDLAPHISDPAGELGAITANVALPSGVAITNTPTWRVTATAGATLGSTSGVNLTLVKSAVADFQQRISGASVVWWHNFDAAAEVNQFRWTSAQGVSGWGGQDPSPSGTPPGGNLVAWVSTGGADGGGFMRLTYPLGVVAGKSYWHRPFAPLNAASTGRGSADPGASGSIATQAWTVSPGSGTQANWGATAANAAWYGSPSDQAANPTKYQGTEFYIQVRIRRAQTAGRPPDNASFQNITGKSVWITTMNDSFNAAELVTYGYSAGNADVVGVQSWHNLYSGQNFHSINDQNPGMTLTIDNAIAKWRYSGGWDTLLYHIVPGTSGGTGANRTLVEVWAQHDPALLPGEAGVYTKIWESLYSQSFSTGVNSSGSPYFPGWNGFIAAIYHNEAVFTTTAFNFDYDQLIFSKAFIPAPFV